MNPFIDLHCHTTLSDGEYSPDEVCGRAQAGGVGTLAITDHNFNNPDLDALRTRHPGLHILRGSEISCVYETAAGDPVEIHVIALNYDPDAEALRRVLAQNQPDRRGYVNAILEKLAAHGISLGSYDDLAAMRPNTHHVGRMQIARAMLAKGYVSSVDEAFDRYIGSFGQRLAYVENPLCYASLSDTVAAIRAAKGIPILCHLFYYRLDETEQHRLLAAFQPRSSAPFWPAWRSSITCSPVPAATSTVCRTATVSAAVSSTISPPGSTKPLPPGSWNITG